VRSSPVATRERQQLLQPYPNYRVVVLDDAINTFQHVVEWRDRRRRRDPAQGNPVRSTGKPGARATAKAKTKSAAARPSSGIAQGRRSPSQGQSPRS
jgi:hypothetical protein